MLMIITFELKETEKERGNQRKYNTENKTLTNKEQKHIALPC